MSPIFTTKGQNKWKRGKQHFKLIARSHLTNLTLADPDCNHTKEVEMLIGADIYEDILMASFRE